MGVVSITAVALALLAAPRPDAEIGVSGELRGGVSPAAAGVAAQPELHLTLRPYAQASLRTRRWQLALLYALRQNWRLPRLVEVWRPLWYHEGELTGSYRWTRRLSQQLTLVASGGELDYFGLLDTLDGGQQTVPEVETTRHMHLGASLETAVAVSRRNQLSFGVRAEYDGNGPPTDWNEPRETDDLVLPLRYTLGASVGDSIVLTSATGLGLSSAIDYAVLSTGEEFITASAVVAVDRRWTRRLTTMVGAGLSYTRQVAGDRPEVEETPWSPQVLLGLTHRSISRRRFTLGVSLDASYVTVVDFVYASFVRMGTVGLAVNTTNRRDWSGSFRLYASARVDAATPDLGPDLAVEEPHVLGAELGATYTRSDRWQFEFGSRADVRGDYTTDGLDSSRGAVWLYVRALARIWATGPRQRQR